LPGAIVGGADVVAWGHAAEVSAVAGYIVVAWGHAAEVSAVAGYIVVAWTIKSLTSKGGNLTAADGPTANLKMASRRVGEADKPLNLFSPIKPAMTRSNQESM
jgi:hypothetical protein